MFSRKLKNRFGKLTALSMAVSALLVGAPSASAAESGSCFASSCNGLSPVGRCDSDAITVAWQHTYGLGETGALELRYSPSCAANWARFTPSPGPILRLFAQPVLFGRVAVWNPGEESYGYDFESQGMNVFTGTSWTYMTDGSKTACTGVEPFVQGREQHRNSSLRGDFDPSHGAGEVPQSVGWQWGPCA